MARSQGQPPSRNRRAKEPSEDRAWLYGRHTVHAALKNPERGIRRLIATKNALQWLRAENFDLHSLAVDIETLTPAAMDGMLPPGAVHQGLAAYADMRPRRQLRDICATPRPDSVVLILDQVTDPQNIGAIMRSAAAFGVDALIVQDRHTPPFAGSLAKAAAGGVDKLPAIRVVNIARTLADLVKFGYQTIGLSGGAAQSIRQIDKSGPIALVLGAEGRGLRQLTAESCDMLAEISIPGEMQSLNVSTAAAIALYEITHRK